MIAQLRTASGGEFTHRRGAMILDRATISSDDQLAGLLAAHFDLHFPPVTRFIGPA